MSFTTFIKVKIKDPLTDTERIIEDHHIEFDCAYSTNSQSNQATITIHNYKEAPMINESSAEIMVKYYNEEYFSTVFVGTIIHWSVNSKRSENSITLNCEDGAQLLQSQLHHHLTYRKIKTIDQIISSLIEQFRMISPQSKYSTHNIPESFKAMMPTYSIRVKKGYTLKDCLRAVLAHTDYTYYVTQDHIINFSKKSADLTHPAQIYTLNPETGLLDYSQKKFNDNKPGFEIKSLFLSKLHLQDPIQITTKEGSYSVLVDAYTIQGDNYQSGVTMTIQGKTR